MTLSRAVALATFAAGLTATGIVIDVAPATAQFYTDGRGFERSYGSDRRRGFAMEPDSGYGNGGYRRYRRYDRYDRYDRDYGEERAYRRRAYRYRDRWVDPRDFDDYPYARRRDRDFVEDYARPARKNNEVRSGGARPAIAAKAPPIVKLRTDYKPGSIVIDQSERKLYFITSPTTAYRYPISVGREGFSWVGTEKVSRIADWPDWHPPEEMRQRDPKLPVKMTGGIKNPLGAKAIYLGKTLYRVHGTNDPKSIGRAASSGCFRMMNAHVLHLAELVEIGAEVHVLKHLPKSVAAID